MKPITRFTEKLFDLPQIEVDLFAPAIYYNANFLSRIAEPIENLQSALCTPDCGYVQRQDQDDFIGKIEGGERYRVKRVLGIEDNVFKDSRSRCNTSKTCSGSISSAESASLGAARSQRFDEYGATKLLISESSSLARSPPCQQTSILGQCQETAAGLRLED